MSHVYTWRALSTDVDDVYRCPQMSTDASCVHLEGVDGGFELLDFVDESVVNAVDAQFHVGMISAILQTRLRHLESPEMA